MLRRMVLAVALLAGALGLWLISRHVWSPGLQVLVIAVVVFLGTAFESWRYRKGPAPHGARWQQTDEKFADPVTGEEMEVEYDPVSGERRYRRR